MVLNHALIHDTIGQAVADAWLAMKGREKWADQIETAIDNPVVFDKLVRAMRKEIISLRQSLAPRELRYNIREVTSGSLISYEAVETSTGDVIPLGPLEVAGSYPEIDNHIRNNYGNVGKIVFAPTRGDTLNGQRWSYVRKPFTVVVQDIPRTVVRASWT